MPPRLTRSTPSQRPAACPAAEASPAHRQPPLLILPGALGVADGAALASLGERRRLVTFAYGLEDDAAAMFARALAMTEGRSVERFDILGLSVGGWFGQCLAAARPGRVRKLVLANSFTLAPGDAWRFRLADRIWPLIPPALFQALIMKRAKLAVAPVHAARPDAYRQALTGLTRGMRAPGMRAQLAAQQRVIADTLTVPLRPMAVPVLIIESDDDPLIPKRARDRLKRKYPEAEQIVMQGAGHAAHMFDPSAFAAAIDRFLRA